jgi:Aspartyl protease
MDWEVANDAVHGEAGTELGSSDPPKIVEKSDMGALINLTNLGATSQFRKKSGRACRKSSRQLLGTDVQVDGLEARALLDPGCEAELVLSNSFATQCGMHFQVDEETLVEFAYGTRVPSTSIKNVRLSVAGMSHSVRAVVVELAAYEAILGKPCFTRHNPIADWRRHELRLVIDGRTVAVDASASPQRDSSKDITRISATQLKKVVRRQEPVYMVHLCQIGVEPEPAKGSRCPMHGNACWTSSQMYFPSASQSYLQNVQLLWRSNWRKGQNQWQNPRLGCRQLRWTS